MGSTFDGTSQAAKSLSQAIILGSHAIDKGQKVIVQATKILRGIDLTPGSFKADACTEDMPGPPFYDHPTAEKDYDELVSKGSAPSSVDNVIKNAATIFSANPLTAADAGAIAPATIANLIGSTSRTLVGGKSRKHRRGKANKTKIKGKGGKKRRTRHIKH
jgi:hypothetical protein